MLAVESADSIRLSAVDLYALVKITPDNIDVRVIDKAYNDDYIPFGVTENQCVEKYEVESLLEDVVSKCFRPVCVTDDIIRYPGEKYGTKPEYPWEKYPGACTWKAENSKKWGINRFHKFRSSKQEELTAPPQYVPPLAQ